MSAFSVDLVNLEKAGRVELPDAANVYQAIAAKMESEFSVPADVEYWNQVMTDAKGIFKDAEDNLRVAGTTLRLIAYSYAATDSAAADRIQKVTGLSELPALSNEGWSDNSQSGNLETGPR